MTGILAIDTATEACSVALYIDGDISERHEITPRQHSQRLFSMLRELLPTGKLREQGVDVIAYGCGPGSFTGLRIAASAAQGLAFANELPAVAVSTLASQAQSALRQALVTSDDSVLSVIDARINEVYAATYSFQQGLAHTSSGAVACAPSAVFLPEGCAQAHGVGSGCQFLGDMPESVQAALVSNHPDLVPSARDMIPLALQQWEQGKTLSAQDVQPVYVRDEISWKKLSQQGKQA